MATSVSTHVLNGAGGGPVAGVEVVVHDSGGRLVGSAATDEAGRVAALAGDLAAGTVCITWRFPAGFVRSISAEVDLVEGRHHHVPVLWSGSSAVVYLGV